MYEPPPSSTTFFRFGSSWAAQRGCWKLFHETPTTQPPAAALPLADADALPLAAALDDALGAVLADAAVDGAVVAPPPEHAATRIAETPAIVVNLRIPIGFELLQVTDVQRHRR